ncbi:TIGR03757 family integrating conjugative element protein [Pseudomonas sp. Hp2]|uniref:TIGR03757 family integrating conjugative element protein n=1 Tax=Pseudomonas sp. Hp2 TaxID=701189 RepID=UPI00112A4346|nr:TIGR03757 family integrating conjugative element protein [Pseudomonas sp. Hp2]
MAASSFRPPAARWHLLIAGLCAALISPWAVAADLIVVTDSRHPVRAPAGARIIELDRAARLEANLAANLPADPGRATTLVQQRLRDGGEALQSELAAAYQGVADAWSLGITTLPAVVLDRRYVVYGEPDVGKAVARIEAHRRTQP